MKQKPNILFIMTDQMRFDTIATLGNSQIYTPNLDRLVRRGVSFSNAYSTCSVCVPARYTVRTGCEPPTTRIFSNERLKPGGAGQGEAMETRCGAYLPRIMRTHSYRTFGIGKFHTQPWDEELGYEVHLHSEELYGSSDQRRRDAFARWIAKEHPQFDYIEALMGERTEMYYMPQVSPLPKELTVERWAADRAVEQIKADDGRPYFGFVSFVGPHPPFSPPVPFNRLYDPDSMPAPVIGDLKNDHMDEQIPWMNWLIWAEDINELHARVLKARYYGKITYIDDCLGSILNAVEDGENPDDTLICFFSDHGEMLGDHHAWQKECFFEAACHIPFLMSWPARLPRNKRLDELVCLTDLFGIATKAAGILDLRDGIDVLGLLKGSEEPRTYLVCYYGEPGTPLFKIMIRDKEWKYIFIANGGREQLFHLTEDPKELKNLDSQMPHEIKRLKKAVTTACRKPGVDDALQKDELRVFPYHERTRQRIYQFDISRGVQGFPQRPEDVLKRSSKSIQSS